MNTAPRDAHAPDLGYAPTRAVNFGWIGEAFALFGARAGLWIGAGLIAVFFPVVLFYGLEFVLGDPLQFYIAITGAAPRSPGSGQYLVLGGLSLLVSLLPLFFYGGLFCMAVQQVRGLPIVARDIFRGGRCFGQFLGFSLLISFANLGLGVICGVPFLAEVFLAYNALFGPHRPGPATSAVIWLFVWGGLGAVLWLLASAVLLALVSPGLALVADGVGAFAAWRRSLAVMRHSWLHATLFFVLLSLLLTVASFVPFASGLLVGLPVACLTAALAYRDMIGMPGRVFPAPPDYGPPQEGVWPPPPTTGSLAPSWGPPPAQTPPP